MKKRFFGRGFAATLLAFLLSMVLKAEQAAQAEWKVPPMRQPLSLKILLLPQKVGVPVHFTFHKQDQNGYGGADDLGWRVLSPSGKSVCEGFIPDDGNVDPCWKPGPLQEVVCAFTPAEPGLYQLQFLMDCDAYLHFSRSRAEGVNWALVNSNFRTSSVRGGGSTELHGWFYLPVQVPGEGKTVTIASNYMHYNRIRDLAITAPGRTVLSGYDNPPAPDKSHIYGQTFAVERQRSFDLYEIRAKEFDVISFQPKDFPPLVWFFRREDAAAFAGICGRSLAGETARFVLPLPKGESKKEIALAPGTAYSVEFLPDAPGGSAPVPVKRERFRTGAQEEFRTFSFAPEVPGRVVFTRVDPEKSLLLDPENGTLVPGNAPLVLQVREVENAATYTLTLTHEEGRQIVRKGAAPEFRFAAGELAPGVWEAVVLPGGESRCFGVTEPAETTPVWAFGYRPAMDSRVEAAESVSLKTGGSHSKLDLQKSRFFINGKPYAPRTLAPRRLGVAGLKLDPGFVAVKADLYDRSGNRSVYEWGFFLKVPAQKRISFDANGFLRINGRGFIPQIIYPPSRFTDEGCGFNTILPNALTTLGTLDHLLARNCKSLDAGCLYRGYYTAKDSTPLRDAERFMKGPCGSHPARIGAWLDEADVHLQDAETARQLEVFQRFGMDSGVNGVCTALSSRYAAMTALGDYLMVDSYPNEDVLSLDSTFREARAAAKGKPVWQLNQGFDRDTTTKDAARFNPGRRQMKYAHWAVFRHGLQGVGLYTGPVSVTDFPELFEFVCDRYRASGSLAFALLSPGVQTNAQTAPPLAHRVLRYEDRTYLIVQNASLRPCRGTVRVRGTFKEKVRVLFEGRLLRQKNGAFRDVFEPLATRIYELQE